MKYWPQHNAPLYRLLQISACKHLITAAEFVPVTILSINHNIIHVLSLLLNKSFHITYSFFGLYQRLQITSKMKVRNP